MPTELFSHTHDHLSTNALSLAIGLIGCGTIARQVYLPLLPRLEGARLVAVADPDPASLAHAGGRASGIAAYADPHELLEHDGLAAVVIAAPSHRHAELAVAAFGRGLHVYIEKPLASDLEDGLRIVEAWRDAGTMGAIGFNCRFTPLYQRLHRLLREGRAGVPVCVRTTFTTAPRELPSWKRARATGGGVLLDLASHHVDLVRYLFAREVERVHATMLSRHSEDDTALLELGLRDGPQVQSFFSLAAAEQDRVEVYGERARLSVQRFSSLDVKVTDNPDGALGALRAVARKAATIRRLPQALAARRAPLRDPGYARALQQFVVMAGGGTAAALADLIDGLRCLQVIDAAERSARAGTTIRLGERAHAHDDAAPFAAAALPGGGGAR